MSFPKSIGLGAEPRTQTVYTPGYILDCVDIVFPEGWYDPFPAETSDAPTAARCLGSTWGEQNFCNPPYVDLKTHLAQWGNRERALWLVPFRSRRSWFMDAAAGRPVAFLEPVKFHGYPNQFPENMVVIGVGVGHMELSDAFSKIATHITGYL